MDDLTDAIVDLITDQEGAGDVRVYRNPSDGAVVLCHTSEGVVVTELDTDGTVVASGHFQH